MKYHSPARIVIISFITLIIFAFISLFSVYLFSAKSPAEAVIDTFVQRINEEGRINVSFSSLDKNIRNHITLRNLALKLDGDDVINIAEVTLTNSFFSFLRSLFSASSTFDLSLRDSSIRLKEGQLNEISEIISSLSNNSNSTEEAALPNYVFRMRFYDLDLEVNQIAIDDAEVFIIYGLEQGLRELSISLNAFSYTFDQFSIYANNIDARILNVDSAFVLNAGFSSITGSYNTYSLSLSSIAANASFESLEKISDIALRFSFEEAVIEEGDSFYSRLYPSYIRYSGQNIEADISLIVASYLSYASSLSDLNIQYSLIDNTIDLDSVRTVIFDRSTPVANIDNLMLELDIDEKKLNASLSSFSSSYISNFTNYYDNFNLTSSRIALDYQEGLDLTLSTSITLNSEEPLLGDTKADFDVSLYYNEGLRNIDANINNLSIPAIDEVLNGNLSFDGERGILNASYKDTLNLRADYNGELYLSFNMRDFELYGFMPFITRFAPILQNYIGEQTKLNGLAYANFEFDKESAIGLRGNIGMGLGISDIYFSTFSFNAATSLNANIGENIEFSSFNITTELFRISYSGSLSGDNFLPYGSLVVENTSSGTRIVNLDLSLNSDREYAFDLRFPPLETISLEGNFNFEDIRHLYSDAELKVGNTSYEFYVDLNFRDQEFNIINDRAGFYLSYGDLTTGYINFDSFSLPYSDDEGSSATLDGRIDLSFDVSNQLVNVYSNRFNLLNLSPLPGSPDISFELLVDNSSLRINNFLLTSDSFIPLSGSSVFDFSEYAFALSLRNESENIALSIMPYEGQLTGYFTLSNLNANRIGLGDNLIDAELIGRGVDFNTLSFSGYFDLNSSDASSPLNSRADIYISGSDINLRNFVYETPSLNLTIPNASLSATSGRLVLPFNLTYTITQPDRDYPISLAMGVAIEIARADNIYSLINREIRRGISDLTGTLTLNNLIIDNTLESGRKRSNFTYSGDIINFSGSFINGSYDILDGYIDGTIDLGESGWYEAKGNIGSAISLDLKIRDLSLYIANPFIVLPVINFSEDSLASGDLVLLGNPGNFHLYGELWSDMIEMDIFWLPDQAVVAHNINFSVWDGDIESSMTAISVINSSGERTNAKGIVQFYLTEQFGLEHYTVEVFLDEGNEIQFRLPITSMNVDVVGSVSGRFYLYQRGLEWVSMSGEMNLYDTQLSLGMYPLPYWYDPHIRTSYDFDLSLKSGNSFIFPLGSSPIISASAAENQHIRFYTNENGGFGASGAMELRAGEIYYFQRSFFIREGNINFRDNGTQTLDPVINLRAQLRSYDSDGDPVDVYLVLREADINNFTPTFESSPAKDLSEIMSILGQAIVNSDGSQTNLSSMVSLVTTSVDVLQRIGIINSNNNNTLQMSIRNSLNLDTFSMHTNIIGNLVYDAVLAGQNSQSWNVSPIARYLDGTALYIGKYISSDLYFEILAHLNAHRRYGGEDYDNVSSFLSSDLSLDVEISLEWENPLCTVTLFTRPHSLTIDNSLRYLGLSFTKRFVF